MKASWERGGGGASGPLLLIHRAGVDTLVDTRTHLLTQHICWGPFLIWTIFIFKTTQAEGKKYAAYCSGSLDTVCISR